jgi:hypothetical protein
VPDPFRARCAPSRLQNLARKVFEETFQQASLNPEWARKWVDLNIERLPALLFDMEAGGGHGDDCRRAKDGGRYLVGAGLSRPSQYPEDGAPYDREIGSKGLGKTAASHAAIALNLFLI